MDSDAAIEGLCHRIIAAASEAVIFADRDGLIRFWNRGAQLIFGHTSEEVVGQSLDVIIPERLRHAHWDAYDRSLETGQTKHTDRVLTTRSVHKDGRKLYVDLSFGLVKDDAGVPVGAFAIGRDVTARQLEEAARRAAAAPKPG